MADFITTAEVGTLFRTLSATEQTRASALIPIVCDALRFEASKVGKDLDQELIDNPYMENILKGVCADIISRTLNTSTSAEPMSQVTQSALGYSVSGTYAVPGGGTLQILKNDLKRLGIRRQKLGGISLC